MTLDRVRAATDLIRSIGRGRVLVGIPAEDAARKPEEGEPPSPMNNATIGYIMENGSPAANIPERPFLIPGMQEAREDVADQLEGGARAILEGRETDANKILHRVGLVAQNAVRRKIDEGPFAPLSPVTLSKRRKRGRTGTKPLIDTGQLRNAITYVVRDE